jgi:hypothetical protein
VSAEIASAGFDKSPLDWYVEESWVTERLIWAEDQRVKSVGYHSWGIVWDPCCGSGNVLRAFEAHGYEVLGTDIQPRTSRFSYGIHEYFSKRDFLTYLPGGPKPKGYEYSIVANPPFSYKPGIAEAFCRRALSLATEKVAMLLPLKWLASEGRAKLFTEHPPRTIYVLSERPSMPPGHLVAERGIAAFERGKMDFIWIVWDVRRPTAVGDTRTVWIPPRDEAIRAEERRQRNLLHKANPEWRAKA